jgi:hypothetical protein
MFARHCRTGAEPGAPVTSHRPPSIRASGDCGEAAASAKNAGPPATRAGKLFLKNVRFTMMSRF